MASSSRRPNIKVGVGAIVCEEAVIKGDVTIGARTVVHPRASIIAEAGPIIIGEGNIVEEMAVIANRISEDQSGTPVQIIGNYNVFEVDCVCEAPRVGDNNILESKAYVGRQVELTNGIILCASCSLTEQEIVPENTIVYGEQCQRREMNDKPFPQMGQLEYLMKILPNYHHVHKSNVKPSKIESST
ncbi:hypothetical protein QAD02_023058 [Eretmocerus hayati]|uniref:Uncharacterized protein n=1 Tax=Eretmocerus hayati TaxID=131215 RepID=A0ACC2PUJ4_9HYME|nr:hypothetical protein QAD02_023058 [Eretmocerus hayati]